jgi:peptide deformylase
MPVRDIVQIGHPALRKKNASVMDFSSPRLLELVEDLTDTMREAGLVGIAAPQIGLNYRVFLTEIRKTKSRPATHSDQLRIFINPVITRLWPTEVIMYEGCGSVAQGTVFGPVQRPKTISVQAYDLTGKEFELVCNGLLARVIQHECDHLEGIMFLEKMTDLRKLIDTTFYHKSIRNSVMEKKKCEITKKRIRYL